MVPVVPPPLSAPPLAPPGVSSPGGSTAKSDYDLEVDRLMSTIAATEAAAAISRADLAVNAVTSKDESKKAELSELAYRENHLKKNAEAERKKIHLS